MASFERIARGSSSEIGRCERVYARRSSWCRTRCRVVIEVLKESNKEKSSSVMATQQHVCASWISRPSFSLSTHISPGGLTDKSFIWKIHLSDHHTSTIYPIQSAYQPQEDDGLWTMVYGCPRNIISRPHCPTSDEQPNNSLRASIVRLQYQPPDITHKPQSTAYLEDPDRGWDSPASFAHTASQAPTAVAHALS